MNKTQASTSNIQESSKVSKSNFASLVLGYSLELGAWDLDVSLHPWLKIRRVSHCPPMTRKAKQGKSQQKNSDFFSGLFYGESLGNHAKTTKKTVRNCAKNMQLLTCFLPRRFTHQNQMRFISCLTQHVTRNNCLELFPFAFLIFNCSGLISVALF